MLLKNNSKGFTLLEVMIASAILSASLLPLLIIYGREVEMISKSNHTTEATFIAERTIEEILRIDFDDIDTYNNTTYTEGNYQIKTEVRIADLDDFENTALLGTAGMANGAAGIPPKYLPWELQPYKKVVVTVEVKRHKGSAFYYEEVCEMIAMKRKR